MIATFRPLVWADAETPSDARRSRWTFKAAWSDTLNLLDRELAYLDAENVVIQADFREADLRLDGMPKANARQPAHPGVRVAFDSKHGPLAYATDTHEFWQHNVRAIALALEALRSVDRYSVTKHAEQYKGWKAIGSGTPMPGTAAPLTREAAAAWLSEQAIESPLSGRSVVSASEILTGGRARYGYRLAAQRLHPDSGGSAESFQRLQEVREVLDV